ncbi:MAG: Uma2 family endonuclease [Planctomycetes bacterium]|nr:Uma2 family endonuclease [Planctomycetota bacterium]
MHRFSVAEYHQMIDAGILTPNDKVELVEGWIVDKMPQNPPHMTAITRLTRRLGKLLPEEDWTLRIQGPITLATSEPEPDVAVARGSDELYVKRHPGPGDIALLIEVADSSLLDDRRKKTPLYAAGKISEFWLINLADRLIEVHTRPQGGQTPVFRSCTINTLADSIPLVLDGKKLGEIKARQLLI